MRGDLVSVVIPVYNRENTIIRAVNSVLTQTYKNIEVIIVDDCSSDATMDVIRVNYTEEKRVIYFRQPTNQGACAARNKGIELSHGRYIAFLDSDDVYLPFKIEFQVNKIEETGTDFCITDFMLINKEGKERYVHAFQGNKEDGYNELLYLNYITTGVLFGKKECLEKTGFDLSMPRYQDWDLVLRLWQQYSFCVVPEVLLRQEFQEQSITNSTGHEKTLYALEKIYNKNAQGYARCRKANTQIHWLMGIHSMFLPQKRFDYLWCGITGNGFNFKRFVYYVISRLKFMV